MGLTNQITSDGILTTWRWNDSNPGKVTMTKKRIKLSDQRAMELKALEERVEAADDDIRREVSYRYASVNYKRNIGNNY